MILSNGLLLSLTIINDGETDTLYNTVVFVFAKPYLYKYESSAIS